jgi:hypothetical protein
MSAELAAKEARQAAEAEAAVAAEAARRTEQQRSGIATPGRPPTGRRMTTPRRHIGL